MSPPTIPIGARGSDPEIVAHTIPCDPLVDLQAAVAKLPSSGSDPVSSRMLALSIVLCVTICLTLCAYWKILPGEAIAATIGMLAGRITSDIGGTGNATKSNP